MIKTQNNTPEIYYNESRDFQLVGRTFDLIVNYLKTATDTVKNNPISKNSDVRLIDLATRTLGFDSKRLYDVNDLNALCNGFKSILMKKGSKEAIEDCIRILLKAQNINKDFGVGIKNQTIEGGVVTGNPYEISIYIPGEVKDIALLEDMLDYVLPTGYAFNIIESNVFNDNWGIEVSSVDDVQFETFKSYETGIVVGEVDETNNDLVRANVDLRPGAKLSDSELEIANKGITDDIQAIQPDIEMEDSSEDPEV